MIIAREPCGGPETSDFPLHQKQLAELPNFENHGWKKFLGTQWLLTCHVPNMAWGFEHHMKGFEFHGFPFHVSLLSSSLDRPLPEMYRSKSGLDAEKRRYCQWFQQTIHTPQDINFLEPPRENKWCFSVRLLKKWNLCPQWRNPVLPFCSPHTRTCKPCKPMIFLLFKRKRDLQVQLAQSKMHTLIHFHIRKYPGERCFGTLSKNETTQLNHRNSLTIMCWEASLQNLRDKVVVLKIHSQYKWATMW